MKHLLRLWAGFWRMGLAFLVMATIATGFGAAGFFFGATPVAIGTLVIVFLAVCYFIGIETS